VFLLAGKVSSAAVAGSGQRLLANRARLDALQAAKPAVQALYQSLNPEQREIFDHPFRRD
jgi:hypothetical protein